MMKTEWGKYMNQGNNEKIVRFLANRLDRNNVKFGREIPIPVENALQETLEEQLDTALYNASVLVALMEKTIIIKAKEKNNGK